MIVAGDTQPHMHLIKPMFYMCSLCVNVLIIYGFYLLHTITVGCTVNDQWVIDAASWNLEWLYAHCNQHPIKYEGKSRGINEGMWCDS